MLFSNFLQNYEKDNSINKKNKNFPSFRLKRSGMEKSPANKVEDFSTTLEMTTQKNIFKKNVARIKICSIFAA